MKDIGRNAVDFASHNGSSLFTKTTCAADSTTGCVTRGVKPKCVSMDQLTIEKMTGNDYCAVVRWTGLTTRSQLADTDVACGDPKEGYDLWTDTATMLSVFARHAEGITGSGALMSADTKDAPAFAGEGQFVAICTGTAPDQRAGIGRDVRRRLHRGLWPAVPEMGGFTLPTPPVGYFCQYARMQMRLSDHSAADLARLIARRAVAPSEVMADHLDRIAERNPAINAVVSLRDRDDLMSEARAADDAPHKGWLHGLPIAVKDLCATKGLRTTWGSPLFADFTPAKDDLLAARMRAAGAIFIGKTNVPEWGQGSHTFNPVFGTTRNPYDLSRSAGGSSGGAAAGLAARMLPVADGSDMMGSLRNPAAFCNVYGFRPTWGLVPGDPEGDTHLATLATEGPMGRTIEDLARLLQVQAGPNPETPFDRPCEPFADLLGTDLRGKRIGWLADWGGAYQMEPGILDQCEAGLKIFTDQGAVVEAVAPPFPAAELWRAWTTLRAMLIANGKRLRTAYNDPAKRARIKPETIWEIEQGTALTAADIYAASLIRSRYYATMARLFQRFDAVALPSAQVWPFPAAWRWPQSINGHAMDTYHRWMEVVIPISLIGLPALSLPAGFGAGGLPMGLQLAGPVGADARILAMGQSYHRATDWPARRPPNRD